MTDVLTTPAAMQAWTAQHRLAGQRVALVPTMGALHRGHLHLVDIGREHGDVVVVSIFVNPLQFNVRADFDKYPRPIDDDLAMCRAAGAAAVYAPTADVMYPPLFETHVEPGSLADPMEGAGRPGHFRGVTTVVTKLFNAVRPDVAVFGQKDYQQLAIIRRMTADLDMGIDIIGVPTVREPDGLAMSSRNRRLAAPERAAAVCVSQGLFAAERAACGGERDSAVLLRIAREPVERCPEARIEYVTLSDSATLLPVQRLAGTSVLATAVWFGDVRLIDNLELYGES